MNETSINLQPFLNTPITTKAHSSSDLLYPKLVKGFFFTLMVVKS